MGEVRVTINGVQITSDSEKTILQAVRENGLDEIPTLCYEERLGFITSCFLCVVEVEGARGLIPSCSTKLNDAMKILTRSPKVLEARKTCLELLFSDHYADCISPCALECPAGVDIQGYMSLVKKGLYREAVELIKEKNPLPIVCGRVCVRLCEVACRRNLLDEPVGIDYLKRYAAESIEGRLFKPEVKPSTGKTVAIVGSGPAGLSAAYYLAVEGHKPVIFEAMPKAGGMLRYGIPAYRLPKELLDREIYSICSIGAEIRYNTKIGDDLTLTDLQKQYDAVLLAMGAWGASGMRVENENAAGVLSGLDILRRTAKYELQELKGRVLVVGGGNTAIDVSRTAVRLGASETVIVYRRTESEMPAHHEEIAAARKEGVQMAFLTAPVRVVTGEDGSVTGLECIHMELGPPDSSGRPRPVPVEGSNYIEPCDYVIAAIGQYPDFGNLGREESLSLHKWGGIIADKNTLETNIPGVYSAGDAVTGPATVIECIAAGRRAAYAIHSKFTGKPFEAGKKDFSINKSLFNPVSCDELNCFKCSPRAEMPERDPAERIKDFYEVELGIAPQDREKEAERCFQCGCIEADECLLRKYGDEYGAEPSRYLGDVNRYQVDRLHPFILIDPNKCIKCGRCVKTCESILGASALGFVKRGFSAIVKPALEKSLMETDCISCGNCIDSCPTGALSENVSLMARTEGGIKHQTTVCSFCSVGCLLDIKTFGRDLRIRAIRDKDTGNGDYLCFKGRFGSSYLRDSNRIDQSAMHGKSEIIYCGWNNSIPKTAAELVKIRDKYGPDSIAVFVSPKMTSEEIHTASRFARETLNTRIIGSAASMFSDRNMHETDHILGLTVSSNPLDDVFNTDVVLLVNSDPANSHPVLGWKIRDAVRKGAKLVIINSGRIDLVRDSALWIQPRKGTSTHLLAALMRDITDMLRENTEFIRERTEGFGEFHDYLTGLEINKLCRTAGVSAGAVADLAAMLTESGKKVLAVYDMDGRDRAGGDLQALADLMLLTGNFGSPGKGIIITGRHSNSTGLCDLGAEPGYKPGRVPDDSGYKPFGSEIRELFLSGKIKAALVLCEDPLENPSNLRFFRNLEFMAAVDLFNTATTAMSKVVMPASTHIESGGSFTGADRRIRRFAKISEPPGGKTNLEIINALASAMGGNIGIKNNDEAFEDIIKTNRLHKNINPHSQEKLFWNPDHETSNQAVLYSQRFATESGKACFSAFPLETGFSSSGGYSCNSVESRFGALNTRLFDE